MQYTVYKLVNCKGWDNERQPTKIYCFTKLHISQKYVSIKKEIFMFNIYDQKGKWTRSATRLFFFEGRMEIGLIFSSSKSCLYPDLTALTLKFLWMLDN